MLFLLQLALGFFIIGLLVLAAWDVIRGVGAILIGLILLPLGYTLKLIAFTFRKIPDRPGRPAGEPGETRTSRNVGGASG